MRLARKKTRFRSISMHQGVQSHQTFSASVMTLSGSPWTGYSYLRTALSFHLSGVWDQTVSSALAVTRVIELPSAREYQLAVPTLSISRRFSLKPAGGS